jgi:hypothetical protein
VSFVRTRVPVRGVRELLAAAFAAALLILAVGVPVFAGQPPGPTKLLDPEVSPRTADTATPVTFSVTYWNAHDLPPEYVRVVVGGATWSLQGSGSDWKGGVVFSLTKLLPAGTHAIRFEARDAEKFVDVQDAGTVAVGQGPAPTPAPTPKPTPTPPPEPSDPPPAPTPTPPPSGTGGSGGSGSGGPGGTGSSPDPGGTGGSGGSTGGTSGGSGDPGAGTDAPGGAHDTEARGGLNSGGDVPGSTTGGTIDSTSGGGSTSGPDGAGSGAGGPDSGATPDPDGTGGSTDGGPGGGVGEPGGVGSSANGGSTGSSGSGAGAASGTWLRNTFGIGMSTAGLTGDGGLPTLPAVIGSTLAVTGWMAFVLFNKRRRDEEPPAPDGVLQAAAAMGVGMGAPVAPIDPELLMPRWRRPSLLEARKTDPIRAPAPERPRLTFSQGGSDTPSGSERRAVRYAVIPLLDRPDEIQAMRIGELAAGDEVEVRQRSGAYCHVISPDGREGWIHRTTLGDVIATRTSGNRTIDNDAPPEAENALAALLAARGLR